MKIRNVILIGALTTVAAFIVKVELVKGERTDGRANPVREEANEGRGTKIPIEDKKADFLEIVNDLVRDFLSPQYQEIKEVSPREFLGLGADSSQYKLYSFLYPKMEGLDFGYIAVARDRSSAFFIEDDESFNDFILSLDLSLQSHKDIVNLTQAYLEMIPYWNFPPRVLWELPEPEEDKRWGGGVSFRQWFEKHKEYKFKPPKVKKIKGGYSVEYYSWERNAGILKYHYFELRESGEIIKHTEKKLGEMIGNYIVI